MDSKQRKRSEDIQDSGMMSTTTNEEQPARKVIKAKRRVKEEKPMVDEEGNELSFEQDSDEFEEDLKAQCIDEQEVV